MKALSRSLADLPPTATLRLPPSLVADLRTDHAGETGAVMIYRGILAVTGDEAVRRFAQRHQATESEHLALIEALLPRGERSRLLPLWRLAGWMTGALPALLGAGAVYATIEAVETFVDQHYAQQLASIDRLDPGRYDLGLQGLRALLQRCQGDEIAHRDEAGALRADTARSLAVPLRAWVALVDAGSRAAVRVCRWL